jgi:hypothetical protein
MCLLRQIKVRALLGNNTITSFICSACSTLLTVQSITRNDSGSKVRQLIKDHGVKLRSAVDILARSDISSRDCEFMDGFLKTSNILLTNKGIHLKRRIKHATEFYKSVSKLSLKASAVSKKPEGFLPGED